MKIFIILFMIALFPLQSLAKKMDLQRIEVGRDYSKYSKQELRRRVWQLERAVSQLQDQVFQIALAKNQPVAAALTPWTCHIQSFGTFTATELTKTAAKAKVLKACGDNSNPVHCSEKDVKCGQ